MGKETGIAWCSHTFNPWWGCVKVSPACTNCYAATFDKRIGGDHWGPESDRRLFGDKHWSEPLKWNAAAKRDGVRRRVFCASMADVFEDRDDLDEHRARLWKLIDVTPNLDWMLLTKRADQIYRKIDWQIAKSNVWLGCTAEDQEWCDERATRLLGCPAVVHFLSVEPQLGPVVPPSGIKLVISGCESGPKARGTPSDWYRSLRDECIKIGAAFFLKQARMGADGISAGPGSWVKDRDIVELPYLDGVQHAAMPAVPA
jgi:protein gp37